MPGQLQGMERLISYVNIFLIGLVSVGQFALLLQPSGWHRRMSLFYTFDVGLWQVNLSHGIAGQGAIFVTEASFLSPEAKETITDGIKKLLDASCTIGEMTRRMCNLPHFPALDFCHPWESLRIASLILLYFNGFAIFIHLLGAGFIYWYWFKKAMPVARRWMWALVCISPLLYTMTILQYWIFTMELANFPPQTSSVTYSDCCMFCTILSLMSWLPTILMLGCARKAKEEKLMQARKDCKEAEKDAAVRRGIPPREVELRGIRSADPGAGCEPAGNGYGEQPPASGYAGQPPQSGYGDQPFGPAYAGQPPQSGYGGQPLGPGYAGQPPQSGYGGPGYAGQPPGSGYAGQHPASGYNNQPPGNAYGGGHPAMAGPMAAPLLSQSPAYGGPPADGGSQPPSWGHMQQPPSWGATAWRAGAEPSLQQTGYGPGMPPSY